MVDVNVSVGHRCHGYVWICRLAGTWMSFGLYRGFIEMNALKV